MARLCGHYGWQWRTLHINSGAACMTRGKCSGLKAPIDRGGKEGSREGVKKKGWGGWGGAHKVLYSQEKDKPCSALHASACAYDDADLLLRWMHTLCSHTLFWGNCRLSCCMKQWSDCFTQKSFFFFFDWLLSDHHVYYGPTVHQN